MTTKCPTPTQPQARNARRAAIDANHAGSAPNALRASYEAGAPFGPLVPAM